ncbi:MAG: putative nucleic-acid-binding protein implicated in transcription termination [Solidesulfovibrio magneticus str. Maddingley MBC34]|uniref:Putative nucleic-acid-binding protein implicated in transcription termination n=1 Tax=Solidesulfovibrio magneticus str. Maddingley MBC34 TaxID=1206767 RepID=K6FI07_9BACT|nr:MAG: putative nucleic-acid-binding protein implicated in transcription termination [Solidesulfovibrio magneticus str. Maddingley MBC34]
MTRGKSHARPPWPVRMCVICRERFPKSELVRHVAAAEGEAGLAPDPRAVLPGRGHYLCANPACAEKFLKYSGRPRRRRGGSR